MATVRVCSVSQVPPPGEGLRFQAGAVEVALINLGGGGLRAIEAMCSHARAYLDEGEVDVDARTIECPRHGSVFELDSGRPLSLPATVPVRTCQVTIDGDDVLIEV
jgi:3-phenylpropionate/trans-cinnamate dioxygenase ferredoxin subunit